MALNFVQLGWVWNIKRETKRKKDRRTCGFDKNIYFFIYLILFWKIWRYPVDKVSSGGYIMCGSTK